MDKSFVIFHSSYSPLFPFQLTASCAFSRIHHLTVIILCIITICNTRGLLRTCRQHISQKLFSILKSLDVKVKIMDCRIVQISTLQLGDKSAILQSFRGLPPPLRGPRQIVNQVQHFLPKFRLEFSNQDTFWDGC